MREYAIVLSCHPTSSRNLWDNTETLLSINSKSFKGSRFLDTVLGRSGESHARGIAQLHSLWSREKVTDRNGGGGRKKSSGDRGWLVQPSGGRQVQLMKSLKYLDYYAKAGGWRRLPSV